MKVLTHVTADVSVLFEQSNSFLSI